uniref:Cadherin domain-containing protein n=1 Tax=Leptobrachium leishanense TaxID=445787 RepID=A0A8C5MAK9_9ANUR
MQRIQILALILYKHTSSVIINIHYFIILSYSRGFCTWYMIALIKVHDYDSEQNSEVDCQILENVHFELLLSSKSYYRIVTTKAMDRETRSSYNITILATDKGSPPLSSTKTFRMDILDINDNPPVFAKTAYFAYIPENNLPGNSIYNIQAFDLDSGDNAKISYSISSRNIGDAWVFSYVYINTETGVLYVQRSFDYEQHKELQIDITCKDNGSPALSSNTTLVIHIVDQNDNTPQILYPLRENGDSTMVEMVPFASEESALITKVVKPLDRETKNTHELILTAMDGGNPIRTGTALLRIVIADVNDNFPMFSQDIYKVSISENTPINTSVICVNATDQDEGINANITYIFDQTPGTNIQAVIFSIHPTKGDIKTKKVLDFETTKNYEMSVQAKDGGGLVTHAKVLIEILDENDNAPEISITLLSSPIPEDSAPGTLIALIKVHDYDSEQNGEVDCRILENVPFDLLPSSKNYYKIVTAMAMDRETNAFYNINDNPPVFMKSTYIAYVAENNLLGTSIYRIQASDLDSSQNAKITYSMSSTNKDAWTGVLYAQKSFDYEQHKEYHMQVTAKDSGSPSLSSNTTLIVYIVDLNDNVPNILYPARETDDSALFEMVPFASKEGSLITKVVAVDADSGHNAWLSYHFTQISEPSYFSISQHTGEIWTSHTFQEMDMLKQTAVVLVDNGVPSLSATVTLSFLVGENFLELVPKLFNQFSDEESKSNVQMYLVIALNYRYKYESDNVVGCSTPTKRPQYIIHVI